MNRIKELRTEKKITQEALGEKLNTSKVQISRLEKGQRKLTQDWVEKLCEVLDCSSDYLLGITDERYSGNTASPIKTSTLKVIAPVQAGHWRDAFEYDLDDQDEIHIPEELAGNDNLFAVRVQGHSMDLEFPDNTILICISPYHLTTPIQDEDCVIVQRVRNGEYETTVKCLKIDDNTGRAFLMPRSSKPEFQKPLIVPWPYMGKPDASTGLEEVEIIGVVLDSVRTRKLRKI